MTTSLFASQTLRRESVKVTAAQKRERKLGTRKQLIVAGLGINKEEEDRRAGKEVSSSQLL